MPIKNEVVEVKSRSSESFDIAAVQAAEEELSQSPPETRPAPR